MKDYYKILGVQKNASTEDISKNYKKLALVYHPDINGCDDERFREINEAYQTLSDPLKRKEYDQQIFSDQGSAQATGKKEQNYSQHFSQEELHKKHSINYKILGIIGFVVFVLVIKAALSSSNGNTGQGGANGVEQNINTPTLNNEIVQQPAISDLNNTNISYPAKFPTGKCVTESGVKICDLSYNVQQTFGDGTRNVSFQANDIDCVDVATGSQTQNQGDVAIVDSGNTYCASDLGAVYIDPTINVNKYFNQITNNGSNYKVPNTYTTCIWTYADGNADIPYILVSGSTGPASGFDVRAFCQNGNNQLDIYSYKNN